MKYWSTRIKLHAALLFMVAIVASACGTSHKFPLVNHVDNWSGSDVPGHNYASFRGLSGTQEFDFQFKQAGTYRVRYIISKTGGYLNFAIREGAETILKKQVDPTLRDSVFIPYAKGQHYHLILQGDNASGKFDINYTLEK